MLERVTERHLRRAVDALAMLLVWNGLVAPLLAQPIVARTLYAGPRGTTVVAPPPGPGPLDPLSVAAYWGFWPSPILARQPIGHQTIATSHNGYVYRPVYPGDPSIAMPNAVEAAAASPSFLSRYAAGPASAEKLMAAALVLFKAGRYEAVIDRLNGALDQKPDHGDAWLLLIQAYFGLANYEAATEALAAALTNAPEHNWGKFARDYTKYFASGLRFAVHLRTLERFVELHPERREGHLLLGYQYGSLGKTDLALAELALARPSQEAEKLSHSFSEGNEEPAPAPDDDLDAAEPPRPVNPAAPNPPAAKRRGREF